MNDNAFTFQDNSHSGVGLQLLSGLAVIFLLDRLAPLVGFEPRVNMKRTRSVWKKGRGKFGVLAPLIGNWEAKAETPMGMVRCSRSFTPILGGSYIQLIARWQFKQGAYEEHAVYGACDDGRLGFWSFTSDGKRSQGTIADVSDIHPQAIGFEAQMPAGQARMAYWPNEQGGISWAVEAKTKKGWKRFTEHHCVPAK